MVFLLIEQLRIDEWNYRDNGKTVYDRANHAADLMNPGSSRQVARSGKRKNLKLRAREA